MYLGVDVSSYIEEKNAGAVYRVKGRETDPLDAFRENGVSYARLRLWARPVSDAGEPYLGGGCDLARMLETAEICTSKGFKILLDFHYSDFWADPAKQFVPKDWACLAFEDLKHRVYTYTKETLQAFKKRGIEVAAVQPGNEVTNGMLWPHARIVRDEGEAVRNAGYRNNAEIVKEAIKAVREELPATEVMIHLESACNTELIREFLTETAGNNVCYDTVGLSYYPYWHGKEENLFETVRMCREEFGKKVVIAELAYAFTGEDYLENGAGALAVDNNKAAGADLYFPFPLTPEGQESFVKRFLRGAEKAGVDGVYYWEPAWLAADGICWSSEAGQEYIRETGKPTRNEWANQCLFDYGGEALPAFFAYKTGGGF